MRPLVATLLTVLALLLAACGGSEGAPPDAAPLDAAGAPEDAGVQWDAAPQLDSGPQQDAGGLACADLQAGHNVNFLVDGLARSFYLDLPTGVATGGPYPVIFNWHGLGDTAANMRLLLSGQVNNASYSFILVTPDDSSFQLVGNNVNWDVFSVTTASREARLFDEVLACLKSKYRVDDDRVHSVGFSLGAILTDMLGVLRGDELASVLTFSGAYFSDPANTATLGFAAGMVSWPAPTTTNKYAQVLLHGGSTDTFDLAGYLTVHFDVFATNDESYLNGLGHDVILCNHGTGHRAPVTGFGAAQVIEFLKDHPRGTVTSPYASALPADFPDYCTYSPHQ